MTLGNNYGGKLSLDFYEKLIDELRIETKRFNSTIESLGMSEFSLRKLESCSSLVSRTFGEPEIVFSLSKQKQPQGSNKLSHIEFRNKIYLNGSEPKTYSKKLYEIFNQSNQRLLDIYSNFLIN